MIGSPRSYSSTKDSGVACLGRVPTHWKVRRLGQIGELSKGRGGSKADEVPSGIPCVRYGDLYTSHEFFVHASRSAIRQTEAENYTRIKFGDALFAGSGETIDEIGKSAVCLMRSEARCGGDIILFRCQVPVDARYLGYATGCRPAVLQKAAMGRGVTVMHVYADQLKRFALPIPPLSEQAAIVGFLDYVDRRIRRYVRSKDRLIALLEEQKQAVIHQAVTGQIDVRTGQPYPGYKDSGVEWLGDVPEHWEKISLGLLAESVQTGPFGSQLHAAEYRDGGVPVINPSHMRGGSLAADSSVAVSPQKARELSRHQLEAGDLVMARRGELGRCALVKRAEAGWLCGTGSLRVRPNKYKVAPTFLLHVLSSPSTRAALHLWSLGATMANLNAGLVSRLPVFAPPLAEQLDIVEFLQRANDETAAAVGNAHRQIDLLDKYRTRLIADVVTGKLDIREAAASLPKVDPLGTEDNLGATVYDAPDPSPPFSESETVQTADT